MAGGAVLLAAASLLAWAVWLAVHLALAAADLRAGIRTAEAARGKASERPPS